MALILEDENTRFIGKQIILPKYLVDNLKEKLKLYSDDQYKKTKGYKRLNALLNRNYNQQSDKKDRQHNNYTISFSDLKRIDFDIRHMPQNNNAEYDMIGGDLMRDFVHQQLGSIRSSVSQVKPVPEVPKLEKKDVEAPEPQKVIKVGKKDIKIENKEFNNRIKKMIWCYHQEAQIQET